MPPSAREAYFALRAFNVEIAGIKDSSRLVAGRAAARGGVGGGGGGGPSRFEDNNHDGGGDSSSSSMATRLRMQWWRDAISGIYECRNATADDDDDDDGYLASSARRNPTIRSLADAVRTHGLTHRFLSRIVEAREADLDVGQYGRIRDVAQYGEDTMSNVLYLTLECVGVSVICGRNNIASRPKRGRRSPCLRPTLPSPLSRFHSHDHRKTPFAGAR